MAKTEPNGNGLDLLGSTDKLTDNGKGSSFGPDSEINGITEEKPVDKYGFSSGAQQYSGES